MKKIVLVSFYAFLVSLTAYSGVEKQEDKETLISPEVLENADKDFQEELLKKDYLRSTEKKDSLKEDSLERYDGLHKVAKPNPWVEMGTPDDWMSRDSAGRTARENKYAYRPPSHFNKKKG